MRILFIVLSIFFIIPGCVVEERTGNEYDAYDASSDTPIVNIVASGKVQKGRCLADARVQVWPLENGTFSQIGQQFIEFTDDEGAYNVPAKVPDGTEYVFQYFKGWCDDEANGGEGYHELYSVWKLSDDTGNINPLGKISWNVAKELYEGGFGTVDECFAAAESRIISFLTMPAISGKFGEMDLQKNNAEKHRVLALANSMILYGRTDAEANDYMKEIATGILRDDQTLKAEIRAAYDDLPLYAIMKRLKDSYESAGKTINVPQFWRIHGPDYYTDLLENSHSKIGAIDEDEATGCSADMNYKYFAAPLVVPLWLADSDYIATNMDGDLSFWTRGGGDIPGSRITAVTPLAEQLLDQYTSLPYNGKIVNNTMSEGDEVYLVGYKESGWNLTKGCSAGLLDFGRILMSNDGVNWAGNEINISYNRRRISIVGVD